MSALGTNRPLVSFLIPAYNAERYIMEAVSSVLRAPRGDIEIIVTDDGSTDATAEILKQYKDPRLKVVHQPNAGLPAARNTGIKESSGTFLIFLDADDLYEIGELDAVLGPLLRDPTIVASYGQYSQFLDGGRNMRKLPAWASHLLRLRPAGDVLETALERNFVGALSAMCVRAESARTIGGFNAQLTIGEDWNFICRLAALGRFAFVDTTVVHYRQHTGSMSHVESSDFSRILMAADSVFNDPLVAGRFTEAKLQRLRRNNLAHFYAFMAERKLRNGLPLESLSTLRSAIATYPLRAAEFLARYCWGYLK